MDVPAAIAPIAELDVGAEPSRSSSGVWVAPVLLGLTLLVYRRVAYGPGVLSGYDTQTYFFAYRQAVAAALRAGRFPLWDAHLFLGAPLFANVQAAVLYPPNVIFLVWPAPEAISASIIAHVWWACWGMALLCRRGFAVPWPAALVGGAMFGLGGFFSVQAGHVNQVDAAAWLPWLLFCLDAAWQRRSAALLALSSLIVALQFLAGHTQESYFILAVTVAWGVWRVLQERRHGARVAAILATGIVAVGLGGALAAVQLIPTFELAGQSIRAGGLTLAEASSFSLRPDQLAVELLPGFARQPDSSEYVAYVGVFGLLFAVIGALWGWRRPGIRLLLVLLALSLALCFGQYDPLWRAAFHIVPGFSSFRVPARWLYVTTFALAGLGAVGAGIVLERPTRRRSWLTVLLAVAFTAAMLAPAGRIALGGLPRWATAVGLPLALAFLAWLTPASTKGVSRIARPTLILASLLELVVAASWLDFNKVVPDLVYANERQTIAFLQGHPDYGRALSIASDSFDPGDGDALRQIATRITGPDSAYTTVVSTKFQDILTPNLALAYDVSSVDGYDGGILPLESYVALKRLFLPSCGICGNNDAILREELTAPPALRWLQLLGVGAVVNDRLHEFRADGTAYDLTNTLTVAPGNAVLLDHFDPVPATSIGLITDVAGAAPTTGTPVANVMISDSAGGDVTAQLVAGSDTAALNAPSPLPGATALRDRPSGHAYLATIALPDRRWLRGVRIQSLLSSGSLEVRALSLRDALTNSAVPVTPSATGDVSRVLSGDVNLYHVDAAGLPVFLAYQDEVAVDDSTAANLLGKSDYPLTQQVVLRYPDFGPRLSLPARALRRLNGIVQGEPRLLPSPPKAGAQSGSYRVSRQGTRLQAQVTVDGPAYLVLKQAWYPGWRATVDGKRVPIFRADLALQAVPVPAGQHEVVVDYQPGSVIVGTVVSLAAALALIILVGIGAWRRKGRR